MIYQISNILLSRRKLLVRQTSYDTNAILEKNVLSGPNMSHPRLEKLF